jgi:LPS sulfotransferase NodH
MNPTICYLICCTQRCGSNFIASGLINSKIAGNPNEFFVGHVRKVLGIDYDMLEIKRLISETMTPNGVFGVRIMWRDFLELIDKLQQDSKYKEMSAARIMSTIFPNLHYIYLTRKDKVRQAISYSKARQTNEYYQTIDGMTEGHPTRTPTDKLKFRFKEIHRYANNFFQQDENWRQYFRDNDIHTFSVIYENLVEKYEQTIIELLKYMKIEIPDEKTQIQSHLVKQADSISDKWIRKYHRRAKFYNRIKPLFKPLKP